MCARAAIVFIRAASTLPLRCIVVSANATAVPLPVRPPATVTSRIQSNTAGSRLHFAACHRLCIFVPHPASIVDAAAPVAANGAGRNQNPAG